MQSLGNIRRSIFQKIAEEITTDEVIITKERIMHSNLHQNAYEKYGKYIPLVLTDPDFIFRDKNPNTAVLIKEVQEEKKILQLILRLHVPKDKPEYKNSVLSFWDIGIQRKENYETTKETKKLFTNTQKMI